MSHARKPKVHRSIRRFAFAFTAIAGVYATATIAIPGTGSATDIYGQCEAPVMQAWEGCGHRTSDADDGSLTEQDMNRPENAWLRDMHDAWLHGEPLVRPPAPVRWPGYGESEDGIVFPAPSHEASIWSVLP